MALRVFFPRMQVMKRSVWPGWPVWNPRPESLFQQLQRDMRSELERMERIFCQVDQLSSHTSAPGRVTLQHSAVSSGFKMEAQRVDGDGFVVASLDVQDFSPQDLTVKVSGDKLVVAGRREVKSGEGSSNYSYSCQEFHREIQLPKDVDPDRVSCCLTDDGKLKIKAQRRALPAAAERLVATEQQAATATPEQASALFSSSSLSAAWLSASSSPI